MSDEFAKQVLGEEEVNAARSAESAGKARGGRAQGSKGASKGGKKIWIIAVVVVAVVAIVLCVIFFWPKKKVKSGFLEGLDVLCAPSGITAMTGDSFLVTDEYCKKVWVVTGKHAEVYAGADTVEDLYGEPMGGYNDAGLKESLFREPAAIVPFLNGYAVSDTGNHAVRLIRNNMVQTVNGRSDELEEGDLGVTFDKPTGLAVDGAGNLYVADTGRGAIYRITKDGKVDTLKDGLNGPMGLCWFDGALYIAETGEHRVVMIKDGNLTVVAGTGEEGDADGPALTATFASPKGVAVAKDGTVYIGDTVNGTVRRVKNGVVDTILIADDTKLSTSPISPSGLYVKEDELYVCDPFARRVYVIPTEQ